MFKKVLVFTIALLGISSLGVAQSYSKLWTGYTPAKITDVGLSKDIVAAVAPNYTGVGLSAGQLYVFGPNGNIIWQYQPAYEMKEAAVDAAWDKNLIAMVSSEKARQTSPITYRLRVWDQTQGITSVPTKEFKLDPVGYLNESFAGLMEVNVSRDGKIITAWMSGIGNDCPFNLWIIDTTTWTLCQHKFLNTFVIPPYTNQAPGQVSRLSEDGKLLVISSTGYIAGFHTDPLDETTGVVDTFGSPYLPWPMVYHSVNEQGTQPGVSLARVGKQVNTRLVAKLSYTRLDIDHHRKYPTDLSPENNYSSWGWWHWIETPYQLTPQYNAGYAVSPDGLEVVTATVPTIAAGEFNPNFHGFGFYDISNQTQPSLFSTSPVNQLTWPVRNNEIIIQNPPNTTIIHNRLEFISNNTIVAAPYSSNSNTIPSFYILRKSGNSWGIAYISPIESTSRLDVASTGFYSFTRFGNINGGPIGSYLTLYWTTP